MNAPSEPAARSGQRRLLAVGFTAMGLVLATAAALVLLRVFVYEPFKMPSISMEPTIAPQTLFLLRKRTGSADLAVGEVVVFGSPADPSIDYVKRVVALEGQTVEVRNHQLVIDGVPCTRTGPSPYSVTNLHSGRTFALQRFTEECGGARWDVLHGSGPSMGANFGPHTVPAGHFFAMGDNRDHSSDSRVWGDVPYAHLRGWLPGR